MKTREEYTCPLEITHDAIKGKWKPIILWQLDKQDCSLADLERQIKGINQKMLSQHLDELVKSSLVKKKTYEGYPLKVSYSLTARGKKMIQAIVIMQEIGLEMLGE